VDRLSSLSGIPLLLFFFPVLFDDPVMKYLGFPGAHWYSAFFPFDPFTTMDLRLYRMAARSADPIIYTSCFLKPVASGQQEKSSANPRIPSVGLPIPVAVNFNCSFMREYLDVFALLWRNWIYHCAKDF
jgi:hypothetical protein